MSATSAAAPNAAMEIFVRSADLGKTMSRIKDTWRRSIRYTPAPAMSARMPSRYLSTRKGTSPPQRLSNMEENENKITSAATST